MKIFYSGFFLLLAAFSQAQIASDVLDINNIHARVFANGMFFYDNDSETSGFEVPADSGTHSIRASHLWIGGQTIESQIRLAASLYNENGQDFWSGPLTTDGTASVSAATIEEYNHVWKVNKADVDLHVNYYIAVENGTAEIDFPNGYTMPDYFNDWPAHGNTAEDQSFYLAPFYDFNNDGNYDPNDGDAPNICGNQALYIIFNDKGGEHTESGASAIGVEVHAMIYAFGDNIEPHDEHERAVFVHYRIINQGTETLYNTYFGQNADIDYGNPEDDHAASFVNYAAFAGTNGDELDEDHDDGEGYQLNMGIQSVMFLQGPQIDSDGGDNVAPVNDGEPLVHAYGNFTPTYGDGITDNEHAALSSFLAFRNNTHPIFGAPDSPEGFYNYLRGDWKNGQPLVYGNSLDEPMPKVQVNASYMFPGVSDPDNAGTNGNPVVPWSESISENPPGDRNHIGSTGPFTFQPGDEQTFDIAYVFSASPSFAVNASRLDSISSYWYINAKACTEGEFVVSVPEDNEMTKPSFSIYPNPAQNFIELSFTGQQPGKNFVIYNMMGEKVQLGTLTRRIDVSAFSNGVYLLVAGNSAERFVVYR